MKYSRLTKEQFEALHQEFINFLATQSITGDEWEALKRDKPEVAEEELDVFSDLIWEGVLGKVNYLENISKSEMHLFHLTEREMHLIAIRVHNEAIDLGTEEGFSWFKKHFMSDAVQVMTATKKYSEDKHKDIFELIKKGAQITKGDLYRWFDELIA